MYITYSTPLGLGFHQLGQLFHESIHRNMRARRKRRGNLVVRNHVSKTLYRTKFGYHHKGWGHLNLLEI